MSEEELRAFIQPDETAFDLFARTATDPIPTGVFFLGHLRAGQVLEVTGTSGTAKSELLLQVGGHAAGNLLMISGSGFASTVLPQSSCSEEGQALVTAGGVAGNIAQAGTGL